MTEIQIFAFFVLPLSIAAIGAVALVLLDRDLAKRRRERDHHKPAE